MPRSSAAGYFTNGQLVAAGFSLRMWLGIRTYSETQPEGCGYLEIKCPEGAPNGQSVAAGFSLRIGCTVHVSRKRNLKVAATKKDCPERATSSGRSPGRGVDSYALKSENLSPTFQRVAPKNSPPLGGRGFTLLDRRSLE